MFYYWYYLNGRDAADAAMGAPACPFLLAILIYQPRHGAGVLMIY
jgi:hypothetical protein